MATVGETGTTVPQVKGVDPRRLLALVGLIVVLAAVVGVILLFSRPRGPIDNVSFPAESTATVLYAGQFPADDEPALLNPLGIDLRGDTIYVAESDAGRISLFALDGSAKGAIVLPVAQSAPSAYPADVAVLDDERIAVVDNAGLRVLVMRTDPEAEVPLLVAVGAGDAKTRPLQPTAVAAAEGELYIADAGDQSIKVYGFDGVYERTMADNFVPPLTFVGGMVVQDDDLFVTDSNVGRTLTVNRRTGVLTLTFPDARVLPRGVCLGIDGGLFVVDTFERSVYRMSSLGVQVDVIEGVSGAGGSLTSPRDVAWSATEARAYITDASRGRIVVFNVRSAVE